MTTTFTMSPKVPDDTVLLMGITYAAQTSDKVFTYVWLKAGGLWYSTGNAQVPTAAGWGAVERWLARDGRKVEWVKLVTETETIYPASAQPLLTVHHLDGSSTAISAQDA